MDGGSVNAEMVVTVVAEMLVGRQHLLEGFSNFLPPACREILLERYTEGSLSHRSREADTKTAAKRENADNSEQNRGKEPAVDVVSDAMLLNASKAKSPCKNTQKAKAAGAICSALAVQQFVGEMPVETNKRKRDDEHELASASSAQPPQIHLLQLRFASSHPWKHLPCERCRHNPSR